MATLDYITASDTGPDVRYEDERFVAYANGKRIDAFDNSQLAWAAARTAVFAPEVIRQPHEVQRLLDIAHAFDTARTGVEVTLETGDGDLEPYTQYTCNGVTICDDPGHGLCLDLIAKESYTDLAGLENLATALSAIVARIKS